MKQEFSTNWKSSTQMRKQRKFRAKAPKHVRGHFMHAMLDKDLREKHKTRSARVRTGDEVQLMRGLFKGDKGVVDSVDIRREKLFIRGVETPKRDGSKRPYPVAVSSVKIIKLTEDKRRFKNG